MNAIVLSVALLAAGPAPKSLLSEQALAGGWRVGSVATAEDTRLAAAHSPSGRTLLVIAAVNAARNGFDGSEARLIGADGKTVRAVQMPGLLPSSASISRDGRVAAVIASKADDPNADYSLLVFDDKGTKLFRKDVDPAYELLAGEGWIVLWAPPVLPGIVERHDDEPPPAQVAEAAIVYGLDGRTVTPGEPLGGALCRLGDSLASVTPGRLVLWRPNLTRKGRADIAVRAGMPFCSSGGSLLAVGDFEIDDDKTARTLQLFDGAGRKTGALVLEAPLGIDAAVAPDGTAIAATAAAPDIAGVVSLAGPLEVTLADRRGTLKAAFRAERRHATERAISLSTSNGAMRTAFVRRSSDPAQAPDLVTLVDAKGAILWEAERAVTSVALDAAGEWLTILDASGVTRLRVSKLAPKS